METTLQPMPRTKVRNYDIEIVDISTFKNGVNVFARVWRDDKQIGFGEDGSVDIERFRLVNPYFLYESNEQEVLLSELDHTISVMKRKFSDENIVKGKRGNTTSTLYPGTGDTEPWAGELRRSSVNETWAAIRAATAATSTDSVNSSGYENVPRLGSSATTDQFDFLARGMIGWDSSVVNTDNISSVVVSLFDRESHISVTGLGDTTVEIVEATPTSESAINAADYDITKYGTTALATGQSIEAINETDGYVDFTLNAAGRAAINKTGNTFLGILSGWDFSNTPPTWSSLLDSSWSFHFDGSGKKPKMVIEHSAASGITVVATTDTFTFNEIAPSITEDIVVVATTDVLTFSEVNFDMVMELAVPNTPDVITFNEITPAISTGGDIVIALGTPDQITFGEIAPTIESSGDPITVTLSTDVITFTGSGRIMNVAYTDKYPVASASYS